MCFDFTVFDYYIKYCCKLHEAMNKIFRFKPNRTKSDPTY